MILAVPPELQRAKWFQVRPDPLLFSHTLVNSSEPPFLPNKAAGGYHSVPEATLTYVNHDPLQIISCPSFQLLTGKWAKWAS